MGEKGTAASLQEGEFANGESIELDLVYPMELPSSVSGEASMSSNIPTGGVRLAPPG